MIKELVELLRIEDKETNSGFYVNAIKVRDEEPVLIFVGQNRYFYQKYSISLKEMRALIEYATARLEGEKEEPSEEKHANYEFSAWLGGEEISEESKKLINEHIGKVFDNE